MTQIIAAAQQRSAFNFSAGTGVLRTKVANALHIIYMGRIAIPGIGQCYINGHGGANDTKMTLEVTSIEGRKVVATLELPRGKLETREGTLREVGKRGKKWKVVATHRVNDDDQHRLALRLPEVKIASPNAF